MAVLTLGCFIVLGMQVCAADSADSVHVAIVDNHRHGTHAASDNAQPPKPSLNKRSRQTQQRQAHAHKNKRAKICPAACASGRRRFSNR